MHYVLSLYYIICTFFLSYDTFSILALSILIALQQYFFILCCTLKTESQPFQHCVFCKKMTPQHYIHCKQCKRCVSVDFEHSKLLKRCASKFNMSRYHSCIYIIEAYLLFLIVLWCMVSWNLIILLFVHILSILYVNKS